MKAWLRRPMQMVVTTLIVCIAALGIGMFCQMRGRSSSPDRALELDLGFERGPTSASFLANACNVEPRNTAPECTTKKGEPPADVATRPSIQSVQLDKDPKTAGGNRLRSTAFALEAENVGQEGVLVKATFQPDEAGDFDGGVYLANVVVLRSAGPPVIITFAVIADERSNLYLLAALVLGIGGFVGLVVRWFSEIGAPLATSYRRLRRLRRLLPVSEQLLLPASVSDEFDDAAEALGAADAAGLISRVERLEASVDLLRQMSRSLRRVMGVADRAKALSPPENETAQQVRNAGRRVGLAIDALSRRERQASWSWSDATGQQRLGGDVDKLVNAAERVDFVLDGVLTQGDEPIDRLLRMATEVAEKGPDALLLPNAGRRAKSGAKVRSLQSDVFIDDLPSGVVAPSTRETSAAGPMLASEDDESWVRGLLAVVGYVPGISLLLTIGVGGFLTQVVNDNSYGGTPRDALELWVWAFGFAVTGGTVLSALGQVRGGSGSTSSTTGP